MKDNQAADSEAVPAAEGPGPGRLLSEARERRQLSVRAVADALHLSHRVIEALEAERWKDLPPMTFVRGYARAYAKLVEVPDEAIVAALDRVEVEESKPFADRTPQPPRRSGALGWVLAAVVVAVAGAGGWWYGQQAGVLPPVAGGGEPPESAAGADQASEGTAAGSTGAATPSAETQPETATAPAPDEATEPSSATQPREPAPQTSEPQPSIAVTQPDGDETPQAESTGPTTQGARPSEGTTEAPAEPEPEAEQPEAVSGTEPQQSAGATAPAAPGSGGAGEGANVEAGDQGESGQQAEATSSTQGATSEPGQAATGEGAAGEATVTLIFSGTSWVDVRQADGERLLSGVIKGPVSRRLSGEPPFRVVLGYAPAVDVEFRGEPFDIGPYTRQDVARFQLPPDS